MSPDQRAACGRCGLVSSGVFFAGVCHFGLWISPGLGCIFLVFLYVLFWISPGLRFCLFFVCIL